MGTTCLKQKEAEKDSSIKDTIEFNHFYLIKKILIKFIIRLIQMKKEQKFFGKKIKMIQKSQLKMILKIHIILVMI